MLSRFVFYYKYVNIPVDNFQRLIFVPNSKAAKLMFAKGRRGNIVGEGGGEREKERVLIKF